MHAIQPHFLLFSSAEVSSGRASRWQFVLESLDGSNRFLAEDEEPDAPSERAELLAVVRGLEALAQPSRVTLVTPSRYVSRGMARCLDDWRAADWRWERFGRIEPIRDHDLWKRVDRALDYHQVDCHTWPAQEAACDGTSAGATGPERDGAHLPPERGVSPVLLVQKRGRSTGRDNLPWRWLAASDGLATRILDSVAACFRYILPVPRST